LDARLTMNVATTATARRHTGQVRSRIKGR